MVRVGLGWVGLRDFFDPTQKFGLVTLSFVVVIMSFIIYKFKMSLLIYGFSLLYAPQSLKFINVFSALELIIIIMQGFKFINRLISGCLSHDRICSSNHLDIYWKDLWHSKFIVQMHYLDIFFLYLDIYLFYFKFIKMY